MNLSRPLSRRIMLLSLLSSSFLVHSQTLGHSNHSSSNSSLDSKNSTNQIAQRIVALTSITSDLIFRLNPNKLVGIPANRLLDQDPQFVGVKRIGLGNNPNLEEIVALNPDLVIGAGDFHEDIAMRLEKLGLRTLLTHLDHWNALSETTTQLAKIVESDPLMLLTEYQSWIPKMVVEQTPKVLLLAGIQPIISPNKTSWAGDLLTQFGVQNLTADLQSQGQFQGYVTLSEEKILAANPQILLIVNPQSPDPLSDFKARPFWEKLQAVKDQKVYVFDYYGLVNPGSLKKIEAACLQLQQILTS
jgi:iron complex transport system substrate-binding protein